MNSSWRNIEAFLAGGIFELNRKDGFGERHEWLE